MLVFKNVNSLKEQIIVSICKESINDPINLLLKWSTKMYSTAQLHEANKHSVTNLV